jgi:hypothetical protein
LKVRQLAALPTFPENKLGLVRGSILQAKDETVSQLGLKVGHQIPIGYDGESVRCMGFDWDIDQLVGEIEAGIWEIVGKADLSDPQKSAEFARVVEQIQLLN